MQPPNLYRDPRPWGEELWLMRDHAPPCMVKVITVQPGQALSLQYHLHRDEFWLVLSGDGTAEIDRAPTALSIGTTCFIAREVRHRVSAGSTVLVFLELAFGDFDEADIVRLEDRYGRTVTQAS